MCNTGAMEPKNAVVSARERVRAEVRSEIVNAAREQMALEGAGALSLRAVARELGMASSAVYRYFKSRDELLTALIIEAYDALGSEVEAASLEGDGRTRWVAAWLSVRRWALGHPHEYTLIYGSPVPGYQAPELTIGPASRVILSLAAILVAANDAGELNSRDLAPLPEGIAVEARHLSELALPGVPPEIVARGLVAWTQLFGQVSFELFGQLRGVVQDVDASFEFAVAVMAEFVGFPEA
jgi:AcrR family transcriptional regulator